MKPARYVAGVLIASASLIAQPYVIATVAGGVPPQTPVLAMNASISPSGVATDPSGSVYFSSRNAVFRLDAGNSLTRIAGNGASPAMAVPRSTPSSIIQTGWRWTNREISISRTPGTAASGGSQVTA